MNSTTPENCKLVACWTGDGWYLAVQNEALEDIAILAWPFGEEEKTTTQLEEYGFEIV